MLTFKPLFETKVKNLISHLPKNANFKIYEEAARDNCIFCKGTGHIITNHKEKLSCPCKIEMYIYK